MIIDGNSLIYRAFFALPLLQTVKGEYTNGVYGFTTMLFKVLEEEKPDFVTVALDKGKKTFRHDTYKEYKGHRPKMPTELSGQFSLLREMLKLMNITYMELENYEADDIIGTFAKDAQKKGIKTTIVSGDKDVLQLVDQNIDVLLTKKGISQTIKYHSDKIREEFGLEPLDLIQVKALMGDSSDNIPGVKGVGEKTALKLIKSFSNLEGVYENIDSISGPKLRENLTENKDSAFMSRELATIDLAVPMEMNFEELTRKKFQPELVAFFRRLEFNTLIPKLDIDDEKREDMDISFEEFKENSLEDEASLFFHMGKMYIGTTDKVFYTEKPEEIKGILENKNLKKICFDYKALLHYSKDRNIKPASVIFDVFLAAHLLQADKNNYSIEDLALTHLSINLPKEENKPVETAYILYKLYHIMSQQIDEMGSSMLLYNVEMPLSEVLCDIEREGVSVDRDYLQELSVDLQGRLGELETDIWGFSKEKFNINSPKQLGVVLFEELNLPALKKTKTGYSTDVTVLEKLQGEHPIIDYLLKYRTLAKLKSTYADGLKSLIKDDGKIHTTFNQTITATGRLSSTEPNLQNIPIRLEEGKKIRKAFVAPKGKILVALDYSQIELRVLAHMSRDENLIDGFMKGQDIHTRTAAEVFGGELDLVTEQQRRHAKAVNFGIVYGMSDFGLSQSLAIPRKEAKEYIERYFDKYEGVKTFIEKTISTCKEKGYVETMFNRRRFIPEINSSNFNRRSFAERTAVNTPIQGSAADIIKKAMVDFYKQSSKAGHDSSTKLLLQVHDELVFLVDEDKLEENIKNFKDIMENTIKLDVPLTVDCKWGKNWMELK